MQEIWKDTFNSRGIYQVSNMGNLRSWRSVGRKPFALKKPKPLKPYLNKTGYTVVNVVHDGRKRKTQTVHKIVLDVFIGPKKRGFECDHINRDRADNRLSNLRWIKHKENMKNRVLTNTTKNHRSMPPHIQMAIKTLSREIFCV